MTKRNFENILKKFRVEVVKTDHVTGYAQGDASLAGAVYGLYQGDELIASYTTDANGSFISDYFICDSNWTLREISPSPGYLLDETIYPIPAEPGNFTVELNQIPMDVTEQVIMGRIRLIKHIDSELEDPESTPAAREQEAGMVMLAAVSVDDQPEEDVDGADVQTEETVNGNDAQTETENTEPEVSDEEAQEPEESGTEESAVPETEPETNPYEPDPVPMDEIEASGHEGIIEQPEKGAKFQIYLASAGSFESAREAERDELITDADGFAISKDLPYGRYVVHQTEGMEGQAFIPDFTVFIRSDEQTYSYILNNLTQSSFIRVEKHDAETGKIIPAAGVGFQVRDLSTGEIISQIVYYPTPVTIDTFFTNDEGWLMLPCELSYGQYELIEQETCFGYVLDSEPVPFTVDGTQDVVVVEKHNMPQKGIIHITKTGEVFATVAEMDGVDKDGAEIMYQPVYEIRGLEGATYEIRAAEDIYTFSYGSQEDAVITVKANDGEAIVNELIYGSVSGRKIDENGDALGGAKIGLFAPSVTEFTEENAIVVTTSAENEAGKGFYNQAFRGNLRIVKTSSDGKVEGFSFRIVGDNYDKTFQTDANGEIFIENLRVGKYTVTEVEDSVSAGYKRPDPVTVELVKDETLTVNVHNDKVTVDVPKTGDNFNPWIWVGLIAASTVGLGASIFWAKKRKKKAAK